MTTSRMALAEAHLALASLQMLVFFPSRAKSARESLAAARKQELTPEMAERAGYLAFWIEQMSLEEFGGDSAVAVKLADEYLELLAAGGSDWPHVLAGRLGVDLNDSNFWRNGISRIENLIERAEALAAEVTA